MAKQIISIFGDENFPKIGLGQSVTKRQLATDNILNFFWSVQPELVYIAPTAGTCAYATFACRLLQIPYVMVSPYPAYFDDLNGADKELIEKSVPFAKSVVILNEEKIDKKKAWQETVDFLTKAAEAVVFFYNSKGSLAYQEFMDEYVSQHHANKLLLEVPYDNGKILLE